MEVNNVDLAGNGLNPGTGCTLDVDWGDIPVGCGIYWNGQSLEVASDELAGNGLTLGSNCTLDIDCAWISENCEGSQGPQGYQGYRGIRDIKDRKAIKGSTAPKVRRDTKDTRRIKDIRVTKVIKGTRAWMDLKARRDSRGIRVLREWPERTESGLKAHPVPKAQREVPVLEGGIFHRGCDCSPEAISVPSQGTSERVSKALGLRGIGYSSFLHCPLPLPVPHCPDCRNRHCRGRGEFP